MKSSIHRLSLYIATIFVSALPLMADAENMDDKTKKQISPTIDIAKTIHHYRRNHK
jgi:hypothetical protein